MSLGRYEGFVAGDLYSMLPLGYGNEGDRRPLLIHLDEGPCEDAREDKDCRHGDWMLSERVAIAGRWFQRIQVDPEEISRSHPFAELLGGHALPRVIVVDPTGAKVGVLEGRLNESKVLGLLKQGVSRSYTASLDTLLRDALKLLDRLDRLEQRRDALAREREGRLSPQELKRVEREELALVEEEAALALEEEKLLETPLRAR